jgi:hypothetical protein
MRSRYHAFQKALLQRLRMLYPAAEKGPHKGHDLWPGAASSVSIIKT